MFSFLIGSTVWIQIYKKTVPASVVDTRTASGHRLRADYPKISIFTSLRMSVDGTSTTGHPQLPVERRLHRAAVDLHPAELPGGGQLELVGAARLLPPGSCRRRDGR